MTTLREAAQSVVDTKDWQGLYFALADLRAALALPEREQPPCPDCAEMAKQRDHYRADRDREKARADALISDLQTVFSMMQRDDGYGWSFHGHGDDPRWAELDPALDRLAAAAKSKGEGKP